MSRNSKRQHQLQCVVATRISTYSTECNCAQWNMPGHMYGILCFNSLDFRHLQVKLLHPGSGHAKYFLGSSICQLHRICELSEISSRLRQHYNPTCNICIGQNDSRLWIASHDAVHQNFSMFVAIEPGKCSIRALVSQSSAAVSIFWNLSFQSVEWWCVEIDEHPRNTPNPSK